MDPNSTLDQILAEIHNYRRAVDEPFDSADVLVCGDEAINAADRMIELFDSLDEWLSKKGYLPTRWDRPAPQVDAEDLRAGVDEYREASHGDSGDAEYEAGHRLADAAEALLEKVYS